MLNDNEFFRSMAFQKKSNEMYSLLCDFLCVQLNIYHNRILHWCDVDQDNDHDERLGEGKNLPNECPEIGRLCHDFSIFSYLSNT